MHRDSLAPTPGMSGISQCLLVGLVLLAGGVLVFNRGSSAEEVAKQSLDALNARDYGTFWALTSTQTKLELEQQLSFNRSNAMGRTLIAQFGIADSEIDQLTPYSYFVRIMRFADSRTPPEGWATHFRSINVEGEQATVLWEKQHTSGVTQMVRESGQWKIIGEVY